MYRRRGSEIPPVVVSKALRGALIAAVLGCSPANVGDVIPEASPQISPKIPRKRLCSFSSS